MELVWQCPDESTTAGTKHWELSLQVQGKRVPREGQEVAIGFLGKGGQSS